MHAVNRILMDDSVWPDIAPEEVLPFRSELMPEALYFMVNDGDGVIIYHPFRGGVKIHPNFLLEKRGGVAYKAIEESIQVMFEHGHTSIYAEIDPKLRHVRFTAVGLKFTLIEKAAIRVLDGHVETPEIATVLVGRVSLDRLIDDAKLQIVGPRTQDSGQIVHPEGDRFTEICHAPVRRHPWSGRRGEIDLLPLRLVLLPIIVECLKSVATIHFEAPLVLS